LIPRNLPHDNAAFSASRATSWGLFSRFGRVILWLISLRTRDVSIVDIFWGYRCGRVGDIAAAVGHAGGPRTSACFCW